MSSVAALSICFIACHGGPADHFATFSKSLEKQGYKISIYASGAAEQKFKECKAEITESFTTEGKTQETAQKIAKLCVQADVVITDLGHPFDIEMQQALQEYAPKVQRVAYYDNGEPYVPGGYSETACTTMQKAQHVFFANANLATATLYAKPTVEITLKDQQRVGIGYYPVAKAESLAKQRETNRKEIRKQFFRDNKMEDKGQKIIVYCGGNNEEYFSKAFPAFLQQVETAAQTADLSSYIIVLQQHPGAKKENKDGAPFTKLFDAHSEDKHFPTCIVSTLSSDNALILSDVVCYYQTSMGAMFAIANIPTLQVAHETYPDILVKNKLCETSTSAQEFTKALEKLSQAKPAAVDYNTIFKALGIRNDWEKALDQAVRLAAQPIGQQEPK